MFLKVQGKRSGSSRLKRLEQIGDDLTKITNTTEQARDFLNYSSGGSWNDFWTDLTFSNALPAVLGLGVREVPHLASVYCSRYGYRRWIYNSSRRGSMGAKALAYGRRFLRMQKSCSCNPSQHDDKGLVYISCGLPTTPTFRMRRSTLASALMGVVEGAG